MEDDERWRTLPWETYTKYYLKKICHDKQLDYRRYRDTVLNGIADMLYGIHLNQNVYGRVLRCCYYGRCIAFVYNPDEDNIYVHIFVTKLVENNKTFLKTHHVHQGMMFRLIDVRPVMKNCLKRRHCGKGLEFPFYSHTHCITELHNLLEESFPIDPCCSYQMVTTELGKFLFDHVTHIPCPACGEWAKLTYNRSKLIRMGATVMHDTHLMTFQAHPYNITPGVASSLQLHEEKLSLTSHCDVCCDHISPGAYEYVCNNMHDVCLICASEVLEELDLLMSSLHHFTKFPPSLQRLIAEYASASYYNRD